MGSSSSALVEASSFYSQYILADKLGQGSYGKVYLCEDKATHETLAVKCQAARAGKENAITSEMRVWKSLGRHPNIVIFKGMRQEVNVFFMLMEVCPYALYDRVMQAPKWTACELMSDFRQALQGLAHMHTLRTVHRDVKVQNFLYGQKNGERVLKLTDFGLSVKIPAGMKLESVCGSPAFMAPEMVQKKGYGLKIDMWALGVTFFMMMHGALLVGKSSMTVPQMKEAIKDPNGTKKAMQLATKKAELSFDDVRDLKFASLDVVKTLTLRDPEERPSAASMLKCTFLNWPVTTPQEENRLASVWVVSRPPHTPAPADDSMPEQAAHDQNRSPEPKLTPVLPGESSARLASGRPHVDMAGLKRRIETHGLPDGNASSSGRRGSEGRSHDRSRPSQENSDAMVGGDAGRRKHPFLSAPREPSLDAVQHQPSNGSAGGSIDGLNPNMFSDDRMMDANPNCMFQAFSNVSSALNSGGLNLASGGLNLDFSSRCYDFGDLGQRRPDDSVPAPSKPPPEGDPPPLPESQFHADANVQDCSVPLSVPGENREEGLQSEPAPEPDNPR
eukprot:TRINITY_DN60393_c0_g1_i1.p1 TRINITY_DN60393_c0_g1~~TRINITY_DN60393_c0_g1_i1.p1  ORF type:complete len:560 (-),score=79.91 TRINITY_DN60393_c0_g1_i1:93-1772(-)